MDDVWAPVDAALDRVAATSKTVTLWWRDDDAVTTTRALDRLTALARRHACPVLLAVIPAPADRHLATYTKAEPLLTPTQHGFLHTNHAGLLQRAAELGGNRPLEAILTDLAQGRDRLADLFAGRHTDILVPPWNRIAPEVVPHLPDLGFGGLSTFADLHAGTPKLDVVNCSLDIIDWRNGRRCHRLPKLVDKLATLIDAGRPIGLLTHHLVHDDDAWAFIDAMLERCVARGVAVTTADRLRGAVAAG
ncbi:polysaccharide deacetylase family protein [Lichenihabitans sp. Uapishka_5]|uniref:polysaccharide deacetylase family protein n=1 Tax=Lichenihabitans sp. Uapishka_5 TaxID=3037302 RepID=UPI0029E7E658|nr:polysaccharide deacetylase family protein [Lichenihabitans sp. Uapishka_5]MDX7950622.1 polysaccharide deacetylase family protein [Lichenihabitans sp. Uapishka_5]